VNAQIKIIGKHQVSINNENVSGSIHMSLTYTAIHVMPNPCKTVGFCGSLLAAVYLNLHFTSVQRSHQIHATSISNV